MGYDTRKIRIMKRCKTCGKAFTESESDLFCSECYEKDKEAFREEYHNESLLDVFADAFKVKYDDKRKDY